MSETTVNESIARLTGQMDNVSVFVCVHLHNVNTHHFATSDSLRKIFGCNLSELHRLSSVKPAGLE